MCGIVAVIGNSDIDIDDALTLIKHRGEDSRKVKRIGNVSIGFNRLSINDKTEKGIQPFEYNDFIGAFNGEIYNSEQIREYYQIDVKSHCDTELILPLFEKLGSSIIHYLDGFYSGIIYNKKTEQIFLIRDYIGKKPLFIVKNKNALFITSELKAIKPIDDFQIVPKGFSSLYNGEISLIEQHKIQLASKQMLKQSLVDAVKKRIPKGEKQYGVFLSGGLDSSILASIVSNCSNKVIYYTLGETEDFKYVENLSQKLNIEHCIRKITLPTQDILLSLIKKIVYHTESYNPSIISNGLATYLLAEAAHKDGLKVVLSGEGADELFCGYPLSDNVNDWYEKRNELICNMHYTELRRLDMASMANTIEIRCPFLDRQIYAISNACEIDDLIENFQGKKILRDVFSKDLPIEICKREKMSFDVGSGIRKMVVEFLTRDGKKEKEVLKEIWCKYFPKKLSSKLYFHSYPTFDKSIEKRGVSHANNKLEKIEQLLVKEFETVPFHNVFMLNNKNIVATDMGGTCSDKTLHFKRVLAENGISSKLHSALINGIECHRMLSTEIDKRVYFIDAGSGWPSIKIFPTDEPIEYSAYGMTFKTELAENKMLLYHKADNVFKLMTEIPLKTKSEKEILSDITNRYSSNIRYPFQNSLRFSKVIDKNFYFIKGNDLRIYNDYGIIEKILTQKEIKSLIKDTFKFNLNGLEIKQQVVEEYTLFVGVICSNYEIISPLLSQLTKLQRKHYIKKLKLFIFENNLSNEDKNKLLLKTKMSSLDTFYLTSKMQDNWIAKGYYKNFARNKNNLFSIAQARTMLQKYIGQEMREYINAIAWILDEDMQITKKTLKGLECLPQVKSMGVDILLGNFEYSSPNPPINGILTQLTDFYTNLCWLLQQPADKLLPDRSKLNNELRRKYPDYYYDLSRKHTEHIKETFWITPINKKETVSNALRRICKDVLNIFGGIPLTRPLITLNSENLFDSIKDSVNRGGNTFIFNSTALTDTPNYNWEINGTDIRRSDMLWAIGNKYYRKMVIKSAEIPIWHAGKRNVKPECLDIDKLREELLGSVLYAGLTDFLRTKPEHSLKFTKSEIVIIAKNIEKLLIQRIDLLRNTFDTARTIANKIKDLEIYKENRDLITLTNIISKLFSQKNFEQIEKNVGTFSISDLDKFLNSMQSQSDNFKSINVYEN